MNSQTSVTQFEQTQLSSIHETQEFITAAEIPRWRA